MLVSVFDGTQNMFKRAFIPLISENHHTVFGLKGTDKYNPAVKQLQCWIGVRCIKIYLIGAVFLLLVVSFWFTITERSTQYEIVSNFYIAIICFFFGLWWLFFTIPVRKRIRSRHGRPFLTHSSFCWGKCKLAMKNNCKAFKEFRSNKNLFLYIGLQTIFNDGLSTATKVIVVFAKAEFRFTPGQITTVFLLNQVAGIFGTFLLPIVQRALQVRLIRMLQFCLFVIGSLGVWALVGYLDLGFGWTTRTEMMFLPMIHGFFTAYVFGMNISIPSYIMAEGKESQIFSLLEVFESETSFFGPLLASICIQLVDQRFA